MTIAGLPIYAIWTSNDGKKEVRRMEAYCVKCKQKREIKNPQAYLMKNRRPAVKGTCEVCGTKVFRIGSV